MPDALEEAAAREKAAREKFAKEAELQASMRKNPWAELWYAAEEGDLKRLQELLNTDGCDVNARDAAGESALMKGACRLLVPLSIGRGFGWDFATQCLFCYQIEEASGSAQPIVPDTRRQRYFC